MGISANPANRGQLVETFVNTAYDKVETVHDNLAEISRVADLSGSRQAGTSFPTTRADGSALISGDTFFNIDTDNHYTWNAGSLSWVAQGSATTTVETITVDATMASTGTITLSNPYILGSNNLLIFVQGVYQGNSYTETNITTIDFGANLLDVGDTIVSVVTKTAVATTTLPATNVEYTPAGSGAVTDVQTRLRGLTSISGLATYPKGGEVYIKGYHSAGDGGGGVFYWDSSQDKANHNGGTIIDPDITFPADWTNQTQVTTWFTAGTGTGCWMRVYDGAVNIRWFGAKGDSTTNDYRSFQEALDNHSEVYIPKGTFIIETALSTNSNNILFGDGVNSVIKLGAQINGILLNGVDDVTLKDFYLDGNGGVYSATTNVGIYNQYGASNGCRNIFIERVVVFNVGGAGIYFLAQSGSTSSNINILNCTVNQTGTHGILCQDYVSNTNIIGNTVSNFGLNFNDRPGITTGRYGVNHRVIGNNVKGSVSALGTSVHGISIDGADTFVCNDNVITNTIGYGIELGGAKNGTCAGNTVENTTRACIECGGIAAAAPEPEYKTENVAITGNVCINGSAQGVYLNKGTATNTNTVTVSGNTVQNCATTGIDINNTCQDITVTGNTVKDCGTSGVYVLSSDGIIVTGNIIKDNNTTSNTSHAGVRIVNTTSETDMLVDNNIVSGNGVLDYNITNTIENKGASKNPAVTFPLATATPSVSNGGVFKTSDTTTITNFTGGLVDGQSFKLLALHAATITDGTFIKTSTGSNKVLTVNVVYEFTRIGGVWYETATS